jgi:thiol-disulfide isomerase/thioredoxin
MIRIFFLLIFLSACHSRKTSPLNFVYLNEQAVRFSPRDIIQLAEGETDSMSIYSGAYEIRFQELYQIKDTIFKSFKIIYGNKENPFVTAHLGKPLPHFELFDLQGNIVSSKSLLGKIVHINFWSPGCYPCVLELEDLNRLQAKYLDSVVFIAIASESDKQLERFLEKKRFQYIILHSASAYLKSIGCSAVPKNFFVNRKGIIEAVEAGALVNLRRKEAMVFEKYDMILQRML